MTIKIVHKTEVYHFHDIGRENMQDEKIKILKSHTKTANKIARAIIPEILLSPDRFVVSISGESGSGKTSIAHELVRVLEEHKTKTTLIQQDDYSRMPPRTNCKARRRDISIVGTQEVKLSLLDRHIKMFRDPGTKEIRKPLVSRKENIITEETLSLTETRVMVVEGTYTSLLKNVDKKIFIAQTFKDTYRGRIKRKRDKIDQFDKKILSIEHGIVSKHRNTANIIVEKNGSLTFTRKNRKIVRKICMLTVHGYVSSKPILGKTDTGGQVTYVLELSKALAKYGIKVDIFTRQFQHKKTVEYVTRNVRIIRIPCGGQKFIPKEQLLPYLDKYVTNMEKFIKKERTRYEIFHSHYWDAGYVAMKLTERFNYFFIHTFHSLGAWKKENMGGDPIEMEKLYRFKERIKHEKILFKKTRSFVMTSSAMVKTSLDFYGYKSKNHIILPAGVNINIFRPLKKGEKERNIDVPQNYVFWVGRFATNKGLDYLLRAFAEVVTKAKDLFLIIGGGSKNPKPAEKKLIKELKSIIDQTQIKNRVFFTRYIKDQLMPTYYRKAKFFVLPSKFEPFGMTAAEAMACGTPTIISHRAGIRKYLKSGHNCLVVNPSNKKDLGWAFRVLNRNQTFNNKIARNGAILAKDKFSWTYIARKSLASYNNILENTDF